MRRYWFAVFGSVFFVVQAAILYATGLPDAFDWTTASLVGYTLAGVAFVVAGVREWLPLPADAAPWYWFAGAGDVLLGLGMLTNGVSMVLGGGSSSLFVGAAVSLASIVLVSIGIDYARGGVHFDLSTFE